MNGAELEAGRSVGPLWRVSVQIGAQLRSTALLRFILKLACKVNQGLVLQDFVRKRQLSGSSTSSQAAPTKVLRRLFKGPVETDGPSGNCWLELGFHVCELQSSPSGNSFEAGPTQSPALTALLGQFERCQ